jgi:hypothetical protein
VAEVERRTGAIGFDAPGARYPHKDDRARCSFEALVEEHRPDDAVLCALARIVNSPDFKEGLAAVPEAAGLLAMSHGFPLVAKTKRRLSKLRCRCRGGRFHPPDRGAGPGTAVSAEGTLGRGRSHCAPRLLAARGREQSSGPPGVGAERFPLSN